MRSLVASRRRGRLEGAEGVQPHPLKDPADGCRRDAGLPGNRLAGQALEPQRADPGDDGLRNWAIEPLRPRGPVLQTGDAFDGITRHPFADGARTDACGVCPLATCMTIRSRPIGVRRALLWMFIRSSSGTRKLRNLSFLDPDRMDNLWKAHT